MTLLQHTLEFAELNEFAVESSCGRLVQTLRYVVQACREVDFALSSFLDFAVRLMRLCGMFISDFTVHVESATSRHVHLDHF